jgi:hypothetical protein
MEIIFDTNGNDKQKQVAKYWVDKDTRVVVYGGSKMSGKSYLGCSLIFGNAFLWPGTHYFIARKNLNDLRKFTIPSIHEVFNHWKVKENQWKYNGQDSYFELANGSRIYLLDAKYLPQDPLYVRFGSMQMTQGWIEEGGEFSLDAKNNLQASIGRWKNEEYGLKPKMLITCNPSHNFLFSDFYKPHKEGKLERHNKFVQALPRDNKMMTEDYYQNLEQSLTLSQKQRLLFGKWEFDDSPEWLIDYDAVCDLFFNEHVLPTNKKYLSTDIAMKGRDKFVGVYWEHLIARIAYSHPYSEGPDIERAVRDTQLKFEIARSQTIADSDGLGAFLSGYLKGIKEFHGGASAFNKLYDNLKSECAFKLAQFINERKIYIICSKEIEELIKDELTCLRCKSVNDDTKRKALISKDEMKRIIGRSPDYLDCLIMRMVFEISPQSTGLRRMRIK